VDMEVAKISIYLGKGVSGDVCCLLMLFYRLMRLMTNDAVIWILLTAILLVGFITHQDPVEFLVCREVIWNNLVPIKVSLFVWRLFSN
jgi:hypothetical protein